MSNIHNFHRLYANKNEIIVNIYIYSYYLGCFVLKIQVNARIKNVLVIFNIEFLQMTEPP